jgi:hypothetical protein
MNIKIVGYNCSNGIKLKKNISKINECEIDLELLEGDEYLSKYDIKNVPGLIINEKKVCEGKVLNDREILRMIKVLS